MASNILPQPLSANSHAVYIRGDVRLGRVVFQKRQLPVPLARQVCTRRRQRLLWDVLHRRDQHLLDSGRVRALPRELGASHLASR